MFGMFFGLGNEGGGMRVVGQIMKWGALLLLVPVVLVGMLLALRTQL